MIISNAQYENDLDGNSSVVKATIDGQEMFVPINAEGNRHWQAILEWVADGNTIQEAE